MVAPHAPGCAVESNGRGSRPRWRRSARPAVRIPERLLAALDGRLDAPIQAVLAPAGWGKTSVLHAWCSSRRRPAIALDRRGGDVRHRRSRGRPARASGRHGGGPRSDRRRRRPPGAHRTCDRAGPRAGPHRRRAHRRSTGAPDRRRGHRVPGRARRRALGPLSHCPGGSSLSARPRDAGSGWHSSRRSVHASCG